MCLGGDCELPFDEMRMCDDERSGRWIVNLVVALVMLAAGPASADDRVIADLVVTPAVKAALDSVRTNESQVLADQVRFCEVPAPTFKESARAELLKTAFQQLGLQSVRVDKAGNVLGDRPGAEPRPRLVVAAHLDTVFPEGTAISVTRRGNVLHGPGIGDNCRGLAAMVGIIRALRQASVQTPGTITFVADVGEEGLGDLRGVKQLVNETLVGQVDRFMAIDGSGLAITDVAVGSHRYRVTFKGPGGHSFAAFGTASPIGALGRAVAKISELPVPRQPKVTYNVGRIGGGTSINAIPFESWMEVDLRSSDPAALQAVDAAFHRAVDAAVSEENQRWGTPRVVSALKELVGDRPAGSTPGSAPILLTVRAVDKVLGVSAGLGEGSTDANLPMSLKIPAITIGAGGRGGGVHSLDETFDTTDSWVGTRRAVLLTIALAQKTL